MPRLGSVVLAVLMASVAGCGGGGGDEAASTTAAQPGTVEEATVYATWNDAPLELQVHAPDDVGDGPVVVHLPGLGGAPPPPEWVDGLVEAGAMVFVAEPPNLGGATYAVFKDGGSGARVQADAAACAIRSARTLASEWGSEDPVVVLSGHSLGGGVAAHVALAGADLEQQWDEYAADGGPGREVECEVTSGSTEVDALVGMAGSYDMYVPIYDGKYGRTYQQQTYPELWAFLSGAIGANPDLHVRLVHGLSDTVIPVEESEGFAAALEDAGYDVELVIVEGGHTELPDTSVPMILDVANQ